jgi:hypothetical protein
VISSSLDVWLKINASPVCFGAKDSSFGRFYIKENGIVTTAVKLVHLSGYVSCHDENNATRSNWGCASTSGFLNTIITNNTDQKILPQDEFITNVNSLAYGISGFDPQSAELVFKNFTTPLAVTVGQEYRIWYGQDLKNVSEANNEGTACVDVYMFGSFD